MKNFHKLNDVKNDLENIEEIKLSDKEKMDMKKRVLKSIKEEKREKKNIGKYIAIAMIGMIICTNDTVIAGAQKLGKTIESFFEKEEKSLKSYKKSIIKEKSSSGVTFMVNEAMLDDEELYITASLDYSKVRENKKEKYSVTPKDLVIEVVGVDGKPIEITGMGQQFEYNHEMKTVDIFITLPMKNIDINREFDIKMNTSLMDMYIDNRYEDIKGDWNLDFKINGRELNKSKEIIKVDKNIKLEDKDIEVKVTEARITDMAIRIKYEELKRQEGEERETIDFKFYDEQDKEINFELVSGGEETTYKWIKDREIEKIKMVPIILKSESDYLVEKAKFKDKEIEINIKK